MGKYDKTTAPVAVAAVMVLAAVSSPASQDAFSLSKLTAHPRSAAGAVVAVPTSSLPPLPDQALTPAPACSLAPPGSARFSSYGPQAHGAAP